MYLDFYGFSESPFSLSPNPRFIFYSKTHKEAFALLLYGISKRFGFIELIGEVGTGKTTVLRTFLSQLDEERHRTALIFNPCLSATDLMRAINREFGIPCDATNDAALLGELNNYLLEENAAGRTVVLVIDEAQNLAPDVLEQIRLISNLETDTAKLIQIILAGQPELARLLEKPELRQINQRIALRYDIHPLDRHDFAAYIEHRLTMAGGHDKVSFTRSALNRLYRYSRGTPRLINILSDRALLVAYTKGERKITARTMALAFRDVMLTPAERIPAFARRMGTILLVAALLAAVGYGVLKVRAAGKSSPPAAIAKAKTAGGAASPQDANTRSPDFRHALFSELAVRSEVKNALQAFSALVSVWQAPPLGQLTDREPLLTQLRRQAKMRHLEVTGYTGSMDDLLRLDSPALLLLSPKESKGKFFIALTGERDGKLLVQPPLLGRTTFSKAEIASVWSGRAFLVWRNGENIPFPMATGAAGNGVRRLQVLLQVAGLRPSTKAASGFYDEETRQAVKYFQTSRRISATGSIGPVTLLQLYKSVRGSSFPTLSVSGKGGRQ